MNPRNYLESTFGISSILTTSRSLSRRLPISGAPVEVRFSWTAFATRWHLASFEK